MPDPKKAFHVIAWSPMPDQEKAFHVTTRSPHV
jgi:hypothetical protein